MKKTPCICIRWHQVFYFYFSLVNIQKIRNTFLYLFFFVNIQEIQDIARQQVKNPYGQSSENNHFGDNYHRISIYFKHHPLYIGALGKVLPCLWELSLRWLHHRKGLVLSNLQSPNWHFFSSTSSLPITTPCLWYSVHGKQIMKKYQIMIIILNTSTHTFTYIHFTK